MFVVYDPTDWKHGPILGVRMVPAKWLDMTGYSWISTNGHHKGERVRKPPWTALFRPDEVQPDHEPKPESELITE